MVLLGPAESSPCPGQVTGFSGWLPDFSGLYCVLVAVACLACAPRAWSRRAADPAGWSLSLTLLAAAGGAYRILSLSDYLNDPHLIRMSLAELLILAVARQRLGLRLAVVERQGL